MAEEALRPSAEDRLRDIESIADAALSYLSDRDFLTALLYRTREALGADTAAVLLLDRGHLVAAAAAGLEEEVHQGVLIPLGGGFAGRVAAERRPVILDRVDHTTVLNPILWEKGIRSLLGVPLIAGGRVLGVLYVGSLAPREFTGDDVDLLELAAGRAALAVQSQQARDDRVAVAALQRSLLPTALPAVPGTQVAARYMPGHGTIGGDWYDVFTLPSGELGVVIGDAAGSGLPAAVVMGRMRSALRSYALVFGDPAAVLGCLDRKLQHFEPGALGTVQYALFSPDLGQARISSAGHPPPVIGSPGQPPQLAGLEPDLMIGVTAGAHRHTTSVAFPPGTVLCFYTDGLVERPDRCLDDGLSLLCQAVTTGEPETVCAAVMNAMAGSEPARDDIALLVVRRLPA
jgi:putative methionine-R-sulfoxide reductase with GAF domain